ncbi:MAG: hypothetical protein CMM87_01880 [Rickettsiales bacterium]|nr:hypothetical protein [Rickettsiales bacterium]|tara:strand:- start:1791 stop:2513 length:723 start_codon:yes stop_codon:yes gene_type:complete
MKKASLYVLAGLLSGGVSAKVDSGFYAGVGTSWNNNKYKQSVSAIDLVPALSDAYTLKFSKNTIMPEIFMGYLCMSKSMAWAPELRIGHDFRKSDSYNLINEASQLYQTTEVKKRLNFGLDIKLGRIVKESTFVYGVLGLDLSRYKISYRQDEFDLGVLQKSIPAQSSKNIPGVKVGLGADVYTTKNLFVGGEVGYIFRTKSIKTSNRAENFDTAMDLNVNNKLRPKNSLSIKVKVGWKF